MYNNMGSVEGGGSARLHRVPRLDRKALVTDTKRLQSITLGLFWFILFLILNSFKTIFILTAPVYFVYSSRVKYT